MDKKTGIVVFGKEIGEITKFVICKCFSNVTPDDNHNVLFFPAKYTIVFMGENHDYNIVHTKYST